MERSSALRPRSLPGWLPALLLTIWWPWARHLASVPSSLLHRGIVGIEFIYREPLEQLPAHKMLRHPHHRHIQGTSQNLVGSGRASEQPGVLTGP